MARSRVLRPLVVIAAAVLVATLLVLEMSGLAEAASSSSSAPGAPGEQAVWTGADKDGFGTSKTTNSKVWYTLDDGELTEVYYSDIGTPSVRDLQFVVSDGKTFAELETDATNHEVKLLDGGRSLTYRQINTDKSGEYRITKTYVTDPARSTVLIDVTFESLTNRPYQLYALYDPSLDNGGDDDTASSQNGQLLASDGDVVSALVGTPQFEQTSNGYKGKSDGWIDLQRNYKMDWSFGSASKPGNVVQTAKTTLTGLEGSRDLTLALGFGSNASGALNTAQTTLASGFDSTQTSYQADWHNYLGSKSVPQSASGLQTTYDVSLMTLAAHEDKTYRGAYIASPSMPWVWGTTSQLTGDILDSRGADDTSGAYHLVWSRDLYQIATALFAAGDEVEAKRALNYLFKTQQKSDGSFPQNSYVNGTQRWENVQLDEVAFPIVLAWQLGQKDPSIYSEYGEDVKQAADYIVAHGPATPQERLLRVVGHDTGRARTRSSRGVWGLLLAAVLPVAAEGAGGGGPHRRGKPPPDIPPGHPPPLQAPSSDARRTELPGQLERLPLAGLCAHKPGVPDLAARALHPSERLQHELPRHHGRRRGG